MKITGHPPIYRTPEEMLIKINEYFEWVKGEKRIEVDDKGMGEWKRDPEPVTITGLCLYLGFESRQSFYDNEKREGFSYIIKKARMLVEQSYEKKLNSQYVAGSIFALKNMGWKDTVQNENFNHAINWHEEKTYIKDETAPETNHSPGLSRRHADQ